MNVKKLSVQLLYAIPFILPLFFYPTAHGDFESPKVLLFLFLITAVALNFFLSSEKNPKHTNKYFQLFGGYLFFITLISIFSPSFIYSLVGDIVRKDGLLLWYAYCCLAYLIFAYKTNDKNFSEKFVNNIVFGGLLVSILASLHLFISYAIDNLSTLYDGRAVGTFGQPNYLAGYLFSCLLLSHNLKLSNKYLFLLRAILILGIVLTFSRLTLLFLGIYLVWAVLRNFSNKTVYILITIVTLSSVFYYTQIYDSVSPHKNPYQVNRFFELFNVEKTKEGLRYKMVQNGYEIAITKAVTGYGKSNIQSAYSKKVQDEQLKSLAIDSSHNIFIDIFIESGVFGVVIFFFLIAVSLYLLYQHNITFFLTALFIILKGMFSVTPMILWFIFFSMVGLSLNANSSN